MARKETNYTAKKIWSVFLFVSVCESRLLAPSAHCHTLRKNLSDYNIFDGGVKNILGWCLEMLTSQIKSTKSNVVHELNGHPVRNVILPIGDPLYLELAEDGVLAGACRVVEIDVARVVAAEHEAVLALSGRRLFVQWD